MANEWKNEIVHKLDMHGLEVSFAVPIILTSEQFDTWYRRYKADGDLDEDEKGAFTWEIFEQRKHLFSKVSIPGVNWDKVMAGKERPFPAVAMQMCEAVQEQLREANNLPNWLKPSGDTSTRTA